MHEYSLAVAIVDQVKEIVKEHKARSVKKITVSAGPYEMVIPELLYDAYDIIIDDLDKFKEYIEDKNYIIDSYIYIFRDDMT